LLQRRTVLVSKDHPAGSRNNRRFGTGQSVGQRCRLQLAERILTIFSEDLADGPTGGLLDHRVAVDHTPTESLRGDARHRRLPRSHQPDEDEVLIGRDTHG
jgi:hypothetical protein